MRKFVAIVDGSAGSYGLVFPDADGCAAMGATLDEVRENGRAALIEWLGDADQDGEKIVPRSLREIFEDDATGVFFEDGAFALLLIDAE